MTHMPGLREATPRQQEIMARAAGLAERLDQRARANGAMSVFPIESYPDLHDAERMRTV